MARILITGSNSGFGLLSALTLARQGHDVIATMRNPAKSDALDHAVAAEELSITKRTLDVADQASVDAALADAHDIDVLINNAGYEVQSSVEQLTDELMYGQLETNVMGPLRTMRAVLPSWRARGSGVIVNNASVLGWRAQEEQCYYAAAKAGVMALTRCSAMEAAESGIRINAVSPSIAMHDFLRKTSTPELLERLASREAFGRAAEVWEVANVMMFLASDYSSYMTGEVVSVSSQHA